jgi:hypothetical protein
MLGYVLIAFCGEKRARRRVLNFLVPFMDRTQFMAVERNGHWAVCIIWRNGKKAHFGKYASEREANR